MLGKMSGYEEASEGSPKKESCKSNVTGQRVHLTLDESISNSISVTVRDSDQTQRFSWPMGNTGTGETIRATLPMSVIRGEAENGGNLRIQWDNDPSKGGAESHHVGMTLVKEVIDEGDLSSSKRLRLDEEQRK